MLDGFYTIESPSFPALSDFIAFPVWAEWNSPDELSSLQLTEDQQRELFLAADSKGREVYYPVPQSLWTDNREYQFIKSLLHFNDSVEKDGYLSLVDNRVVSATIWLEDEDITLYAVDRLVADEENPTALARLIQEFNLRPCTSLDYSSSVQLGDNALSGSIELM